MTTKTKTKTKTKPDEKLTDAQRMLNAGATMKHKGMGRDLVVREMTMESIINCASELAVLMTTIDWASDSANITLIPIILKEEATAKAFKMFASESTGTKITDWDNIPVIDWVRFVVTAKKVNDWEELRELFKEAGLAAHFGKKKKDSQENQTQTNLPG